MPTTDRVTGTGDDLFHTEPQPMDEKPSAVGARARAVRRLVGAASLPALFLVMVVGTAIDPLDDAAPAGPTMAAASRHAGAITTLAWLELLAAALCVGGLLTLVGAIRGRGAGFANAVGVLGVLTAVGMGGIGINHFVVAGLSQSGLSAANTAKALDAFHSAGGPLIILFFLPPLTFLLATVAAWRAGLVPKAALIVGVLFAVTSVVPGPAPVAYISLGVGLVLTSWIAKALLTARD